MEEMLFIHAVQSQSNKPTLAMCTVNDWHKVTFEIDAGASCNILPSQTMLKQQETDKEHTLSLANHAQ